MENQLEGYVIYYKKNDKNIPFGVVSDNYDCKAISNHVPNSIKDFLIEIEDIRFYSHNGIDLKGMSRAFIENIKAGRIVQGGSTISQQLARNLIRNNQKTIYRKLKEILKAIQIESQFTKEEILTNYFNNVYFGKNIWGLRAAGLHYFSKEVDKLNQIQLLYLLTILRGPNYYLKRPEDTFKRFKKINNILFQRNQISEKRLIKNLKFDLNLVETNLTNIKKASIPFIIESIDNKQKKINSTIDPKIQNFTKKFIADSNYPVSIIAIRKDKVVGFSSSYGTDYPFISKSNVGSTLKPFIYCFLRDNGISKTERFNALKNNSSWNVREVGYYNSKLNIQEALFYSNNNTFINAVNKVGIDNSLQFLAEIFKKPETDFFPSSILGATKNGISIYELALTYSRYFSYDNLTENKKECLSILNKIFQEKLGHNIENAFLKTGTTNDNKERYAILGNADLTYVVLRNENSINDESKEGGFMYNISRSISSMFKSKMNYSWI